jgi:hypothetical protein
VRHANGPVESASSRRGYARDAAASDATNSSAPVATFDSGPIQILAPPDASNPAPKGSDNPCGDAGPLFFQIAGDGPEETWRVECATPPWTLPIAFRQFGGEGDGVGHETAAACGSLDAGAFVISVSAFQRTAGTSDAGLVAYKDATGRAWSGQGEVTFNEWGPIGTVAEGTYAVSVALVAHPDAGPTLSLSGSFRVCHAYDAPQAP